MEGNYCNGLLQIDRENGIITFSSQGITILRITHLPTPIPTNVVIDVVAVNKLTGYIPSYRPSEYIAPVETGEPFRNAAEADWDSSRE